MKDAGKFGEDGFFLVGGQFDVFFLGEGGADGGDGVQGGKFVLQVLAKVLAEDSADAVADRGAADEFLGDDESEPGGPALFAEAERVDSRPLYFAPAPGGVLELTAADEKAVCGQGNAGRKRRGFWEGTGEGGVGSGRVGGCGRVGSEWTGRGGAGWGGRLGGESDAAFASAGVEDGAAMA